MNNKLKKKQKDEAINALNAFNEANPHTPIEKMSFNLKAKGKKCLKWKWQYNEETMMDELVCILWE